MSSSHTSASNLSTVPILDGTNYYSWAEKMQAYLQFDGTWIYTRGIIERPGRVDDDNPTEEENKTEA